MSSNVETPINEVDLPDVGDISANDPVAKVYYDSKWKDYAKGTVVDLTDGGTAVIGTDAFGIWDDACEAAATALDHEIVMNGTHDADSFYCEPLWKDLPLYTVVYLNPTAEEKQSLPPDAIIIEGGTYFGEYAYGEGTPADPYYLRTTTHGKMVIGINAFTNYDDALEAGEKYGLVIDEEEETTYYNIYAGDVYVDTNFAGGAAGEVFYIPDGRKCIIGVNAVAPANMTTTGTNDALLAAADLAKQYKGAICVTGGSYSCSGSSGNLTYVKDAKTVVMDDTYFKWLSGGGNSGTEWASSEIHLLGGSCATVSLTGRGKMGNGYLYIGQGAKVGTARICDKDGSTPEVAVATIDVDGGAFGVICGGPCKLTEAFNVNIANVKSGRIQVSENGAYGGSFYLFEADVNLTVRGSTLEDFRISHRSASAWQCYNIHLGNFNISLTDSKIAGIYTATTESAVWSAESYAVTLVGSTVTGTLNPGAIKTSNGYGYLAYNGGTAFITGGTYCTLSSGISYKDLAPDTMWTDGCYHYLGATGIGSTPKIVKNADGTMTVTNAVFYNADAESGKRYIIGGTATFSGGEQALFELNIKGDKHSYINTLGGIDCITIDAAADLALASDVASGVAITIDATGYTLTDDRKLVLTTTGSLNATNITVVENGVPSKKFSFAQEGKNLYLVKGSTYFSVGWEGLANGTPVTVGDKTYYIGDNAFFKYDDAKTAAQISSTIVKSPDAFFSYDWTEKSAGDSVDIISRSGTFSTKIGDENIPAYNTFADAATAAKAGAWLNLVGGSKTLSGRNEWQNYKNTVMTNTVINASGSVNGGLITVFDSVTNKPTYQGSFTVGVGSYLTSFATIGNLTPDKHAIFDTYRVEVIDGGSIGTIYYAGYGGYCDGKVVINITNGGRVATVASSLSSGRSGGDVTVTIGENSRIGTYIFAPSADATPGYAYIEDNCTISLNLVGGTIGKLEQIDKKVGALVKGENSKVVLNVSGGVTSTIGTFKADMKTVLDEINITIGSVLAVGSSLSDGYTGEITVDATDCTWDKGSYLILSSTDAVTNTITVNGGRDNYKIVHKGGDVYYEMDGVYFSDTYMGLPDGTPVTVPGGTAVIGTDAFFKYADAKKTAGDLRPIKSSDNFFSYEWVGDEVGTDETVVYRGGEFSAKISDSSADIKLYNTLTDAQTATGKTGTLLITGGSGKTATSGREQWSYGNVVVTGATITQGSTNAGTHINIGFTGGDSVFTVGDKAYVQSIGAGNSGSSTVTDHTSRIVILAGGSAGLLFFQNGSGGTFGGDAFIDITGGRVDAIRTVDGSSTNDGDVFITVTDGGYLGSLVLSPAVGSGTFTLTENHTLSVTLDGASTIDSFAARNGKVVKKDGAQIILAVGEGGGSITTGTRLSDFDSLTIKIGDTGTSGLTVGSAFNYTGTITVDVNDCHKTLDRYLVLSEGTKILSLDTFSITGTDSDKFRMVREGNKYYVEQKPFYFSNEWKDIPDGTPVTVPGGTAVIGTDAFFKYDDAKTAAGTAPLRSSDNFFSYDWVDLPKGGDPQKVVCPSGTFFAPISDSSAYIKLYNTLADAQTATGKTGTLLITGGAGVISTGASGGRFGWDYGHVIATNTYMYVTGGPNGAAINIGANGSSNTFTVGEGAYVHSIGAGTVANGGTVTIKSSTIEVIDGGTVANIFVTQSASGTVAGTVNVYLDGGTVLGKIAFGTQGHSANDGDVDIFIANDSYVDTLFTSGGKDQTWTLTAGHTMTVTLDNSTVGMVDKYGNISTEGATVALVVNGASTIGTDNRYGMSQFTAITINIDEGGCGLTVGGSSFTYTGTITADLSACDFEDSRYLVISARNVSVDQIQLTGGASSAYELVKDGNAIYYQKKPVYFSYVCESLGEGDPVHLAGQDLIYTQTAFMSEAQARSLGFNNPAIDADTWFNGAYNATDPITVPACGGGDFNATFGKDAFNALPNAVTNAINMEGKLFITGGSYTELRHLDGVANINVNDIGATPGERLTTVNSFYGQEEADTVADHLSITVANSDIGNYFNGIYAGRVTNNVEIDFNNSTVGLDREGFFIGVATGGTAGSLDITIRGETYLRGGLFAVFANNTGAGEVTGDVQVTLDGGTILKHGVMIHSNAIVGGSSNVLVVDNTTVSSITNFDAVEVQSGATLTYGKYIEGEWEPGFLSAMNTVVNHGAIDYVADILVGQGQCQKVIDVYDSASTGTIDSSTDNRFIYAKGGVYAASVQNRVFLDATVDGKANLDDHVIGTGTYAVGLSVFKDADAANAADVTDAPTTYIQIGDGYARNGNNIGFGGGAVTGKVAAATTVGDSNVDIWGVQGRATSFATVIGGLDATAHGNITGNSKVTVGGDAGTEIHGRAIIGASYLTNGAGTGTESWTFGTEEVHATSTVVFEQGSLDKLLIGGALLNYGGVTATGYLDTNVTMNGGVVGTLIGGNYVQGRKLTEQFDEFNRQKYESGMVNTSGDSNVFISGGTVLNNVYGGNAASGDSIFAPSDGSGHIRPGSSKWYGNTAITIDASSSKIEIGGHLYAGNSGGGVSGNTSLTLKGLGDNLSIAGNVTGDSNHGGEGDGKSDYVDGTRFLAFDSFNGTFNYKTLSCFDDVNLSGSQVSLGGNETALSDVSVWSFDDQSALLDWTLGKNNFTGDQLTVDVLGEHTVGDKWTVLSGSEAILDTWASFKTDKSSTKNSVKIGDQYCYLELDQTGKAIRYASADYSLSFETDSQDASKKLLVVEKLA